MKRRDGDAGGQWVVMGISRETEEGGSTIGLSERTSLPHTGEEHLMTAEVVTAHSFDCNQHLKFLATLTHT